MDSFKEAPGLSKHFLGFSQVLAGLVIFTGVLVLIGWSADISFLKSVFHGLKFQGFLPVFSLPARRKKVRF